MTQKDTIALKNTQQNWYDNFPFIQMNEEKTAIILEPVCEALGISYRAQRNQINDEKGSLKHLKKFKTTIKRSLALEMEGFYHWVLNLKTSDKDGQIILQNLKSIFINTLVNLEGIQDNLIFLQNQAKATQQEMLIIKDKKQEYSELGRELKLRAKRLEAIQNAKNNVELQKALQIDTQVKKKPLKLKS